MPFKTKKQKQRAQKTRITISEQGLAIYAAGDSLSTGKVQQAKKVLAESGIDIGKDYKYVKAEIIKTALFALVIIGLQIAFTFSHIAF